jgi:hypothetical protein
MGTFTGHALPGGFFIVFALWWTFKTFQRYFYCQRVNKPFHGSLTYKCSCLCGCLKDWELEGFIKIFCAVVGFIGEVVTAHENGIFVHMGNGQHATMFFVFGFSGVLDILIHHNFPLPKGIGYVWMIITFSVEAVLFKFHLHGRTLLDVQVHILLLYTVYANVLCAIGEFKFQKSVFGPLSRAYFVFLQGTWFWQVGFILYNPVPGSIPWDEESHEQHMIVTMMFTWHMAVVFIIMMLIGALVACLNRCRNSAEYREHDPTMQMQLIKKNSNGHTIVDFNDESESDIEFEKPHRGEN